MAKKAKKPVPQGREEASIKSFLDMIAPSVVSFMPDHFICGNTFRCVWALREYPTSTDEQAILRHLGEKDGVTLRIYTRQVTPAEEKRIIQNAANKNRMNSSNTNSGGWTSCAMRSTHLPAILALMPTEVQNGIREVNKLTSAGSQSATINTTADKLFLLSEIEIFGSVSYSKSGEGTQYDYYKAGNSKVKKFNGSASDWWERSPYGSSSAYFCFVNSYGDADCDNASGAIGVAFGFCF